jgi:hypothetical protein
MQDLEKRNSLPFANHSLMQECPISAQISRNLSPFGINTYGNVRKC